MRPILLGLLIALLAAGSAEAADKRPIIDAHIHYSHDAWDELPPESAVAALRAAGLKQAFVSSSSDEGTQKLHAVAPDLIVPVLRPYRRRGELGTWMHDGSVVDMLKDRLARYRYAGIGEFHVFGEDADLPVLREVVALAGRHRLFLHAHSDAEAVRRLFAQDPEARILWAHSGFAPPEEVAKMLAAYPHLWSDLAFRSEHGGDGRVPPEWRRVFEAFPDRFMVGTDTYTPERWYYVAAHADWSRAWLDDLPDDLADNIAWRNAKRLADWALQR